MTELDHPNLLTGILADLPRRRAELLGENALLRQQLIVLRRRTKPPRPTWREHQDYEYPVEKVAEAMTRGP